MSWSGITFMYLPGQTQAVPAGKLELFEEGTQSTHSTFAYGSRYLARTNAVPVDPRSLPLSCQPGNLALYEPPAGLSVFGALRDAAPDFWGRRVIEAKLKAPPNGLPESTYLLHTGLHRWGALDVRQAPNAPENLGALPPLTDLRYLLEAADRVQDGLAVPTQLQQLFEVATLGGTRPKALVLKEGKQCLAKFPSKNDRYNIPLVERACLELARQCGLRVPPTDLIKLPDGRSVMLIERFDRDTLADGTFCRHHCVSALTMLGKHEQQSLGASYAEIAQAILDQGVDGHVHADCCELFARVAFNVLVSNDDDHLRNHAFMWDPAGKGWRLSPLYDVVPHPQLTLERLLHLSIGPEGRSATLTNLLQAHGSFGLLKPDATDIINRVAQGVRQWRVSFEALGVSSQDCDLIASAFRRPRDVGW